MHKTSNKKQLLKSDLTLLLWTENKWAPKIIDVSRTQHTGMFVAIMSLTEFIKLTSVAINPLAQGAYTDLPT